MKKIIISLLLLITSSIVCMEKKFDQFATDLAGLVQSELDTVNRESAQSLIDSKANITPTNIAQMLEAAKVTNQDLSREQLNQAARIIGLQQMQTSHNANTLSEFVLNYSTEQNGKLRFRLLDFFLHENNKTLEPHDKFYLGWKFLFEETGEERKQAVMRRLLEFIWIDVASKSMNYDRLSPYHELQEEIIESKRGTKEYTDFAALIERQLQQSTMTNRERDIARIPYQCISVYILAHQIGDATHFKKDEARASVLRHRYQTMCAALKTKQTS